MLLLINTIADTTTRLASYVPPHTWSLAAHFDRIYRHLTPSHNTWQDIASRWHVLQCVTILLYNVFQVSRVPDRMVSHAGLQCMYGLLPPVLCCAVLCCAVDSMSFFFGGGEDWDFFFMQYQYIRNNDETIFLFLFKYVWYCNAWL